MNRTKLGLNNIVVWEAITNNSYETLRQTLTEECRDWADKVSVKIVLSYLKAKDDVSDLYASFNKILPSGYSRKEFAFLATKSNYKPLLFLLFDGRLTDYDIMRFIKPKQINYGNF